ncbi:CBS domain-containing protein [Spiractinospora alimapuensis]|uniref:CBS domain-containing protein n=1 Tax=Spiractinospora alimapuensis TaxID=2820884 RepID=UPI001F268383|nr:CBS domain-containing protein [Spiractinospora alimapuensis]QVQ50048.1 CBS domain-containing protein [Spiractinospora alimapuensis]
MSTIARDVMTTDVATVTPDTAYKEVARTMVSRDVSALPVITDGKIVGIITETDMLHKEEFKPQDYGEEYASPLRARLRRKLGTSGAIRRKANAEQADQLMSTRVVTVHPDDNAVTIARVMDRFDVKQVPVVDERNHLLGLVSRRDLLGVFVRADEDIKRDVERAIQNVPAWIEPADLSFTVREGIVRAEGRLHQHSNVPVVIQIIEGVDGVVAVDSHLAWQMEDLLPPQ